MTPEREAAVHAVARAHGRTLSALRAREPDATTAREAQEFFNALGDLIDAAVAEVTDGLERRLSLIETRVAGVRDPGGLG